MLMRIVWSGLLVAGLALAQRGRGGGQSGLDDNTPQLSSTPTNLDRMTNVLGLNKDQRKLIKGIMDDGQKEAAPLREPIAKSLLQIGEAVQSGKSQGDVQQAVNAHAALDTQMAKIEMQCFAKIYTALDVNQRSKAGPVFLMMHGIFMGKNWIDLR